LRKEDQFTSESVAYSNLLSGHFQKTVNYLPYPPVDITSYESSSVPSDNSDVPLNALYIGIPRLDKGFLELPNIVEKLTLQNWICTIQGYSGKCHQLLECLEKLRSIPGVNIINDIPSDREIQQYIIASDLILLPYSPLEFKYRNSAMNFNCLYLGKPTASFPSTSLYATSKSLELAVDLSMILADTKKLGKLPKSKPLSTTLISRDWRKFIS
jgi:hypothetical protein